MMKWEINKIKKIMSLKSLKFPFRHPQTSHFESTSSQYSPWKSDNFRLIFIGGIFSNRCGGGEGNWKNGSNMDEQIGCSLRLCQKLIDNILTKCSWQNKIINDDKLFNNSQFPFLSNIQDTHKKQNNAIKIGLFAEIK